MTPTQALTLLLRHAAAAHATGATTPAELEAAVVSAKVLADALTPPKPTDTPPTPSEKPE